MSYQPPNVAQVEANARFAVAQGIKCITEHHEEVMDQAADTLALALAEIRDLREELKELTSLYDRRVGMGSTQG